MRRLLLYSLLIATAILIFLNLSIGTYFEGYEPIYNALFANEFTAQIDFSLFLPNWLGTIPLFSCITVFFHTAQGYSICATIFNALILWAYLFSILVICHKNNLGPLNVSLVVLVFICLYLENLVYVYNLRVSFCAVISAFLLSYVIRTYDLHKGGYLVAFLLAVLGSTARVEIGFLVAIVLLIFCVLFLKKMLPEALVLLVIASSVFGFYKSYQHYVTPQYEALLGMEHIMDDRGGVRYLTDEDPRRQELVKAMAMYLQDDPVYTMENYRKEIEGVDFAEYVSSVHFRPIYLKKLEELRGLLGPYFWLFLVTILMGAVGGRAYWPTVADKRAFCAKIFLMTMLLVALILFLNIVVIVPHNFILCMAISICLLFLIVFVRMASERRLKYSLLIWACVLMPLVWSAVRGVCSYERSLEERASSMRSLMEDLQKEGKHIIFATNADESYYPARLFSRLYDHRIVHYYQEFYLSRYPFFERHSREYFGNGYSSMQRKFKKMSDDPQAAYISNDQINKNMMDYMWVMHGVRISFDEIPNEHSASDLKAYHVSETER